MGGRFEDFIVFAIEQERKAAELYEKYAELVQSRSAKQTLSEMAAMERGHEAKLQEFQKTGIAFISRKGEMEDLHVSDFFVESPLTEKSAVEEVIIFAMKAEDKAYRLYSRLAELEQDAQVKKLFSSLASEEKKHKYDLETEYEKMFMREN